MGEAPGSDRALKSLGAKGICLEEEGLAGGLNGNFPFSHIGVVLGIPGTLFFFFF